MLASRPCHRAASPLAIVLALVLSLALAWPAQALAAGDETPASQQTTTQPEGAPETPEQPLPVQPAPGASAPAQTDQQTPAPSKAKTKKFKVKALKTSFTKTPKESISNTIKVSPTGKRQVLLQMYQTSKKKWVTKATFTTKKNGSVTLKYPKDWQKQSRSTWRIVIKASDKYARYTSKSIEITTKNRTDLKLKCKSALIMDADSKQVFYNLKENVKRQNASTTKLMTALVALEKNKLSDKVRITKQAVNVDYSNLGKRAIGDYATVKDLLYMTLLPSDNGAAEALALHTSGTEKKFVALMNKRAKKLGCKHTTFKTPHGLTRKGHGTSAYDLALITREALKHNEFRKALRTKAYKFRTRGGIPYSLETTNKLLGKPAGVIGGKTGFTNAAGQCYVGVFKRKGHTYVTVVLGCETSDQRWSDAKKLFGYIQKYL